MIKIVVVALKCINNPCGTFPCVEAQNSATGYLCQCGPNDFRPSTCPGIHKILKFNFFSHYSHFYDINQYQLLVMFVQRTFVETENVSQLPIHRTDTFVNVKMAHLSLKSALIVNNLNN